MRRQTSTPAQCRRLPPTFGWSWSRKSSPTCRRTSACSHALTATSAPTALSRGQMAQSVSTRIFVLPRLLAMRAFRIRSDSRWRRCCCHDTAAFALRSGVQGRVDQRFDVHLPQSSQRVVGRAVCEFLAVGPHCAILSVSSCPTISESLGRANNNVSGLQSDPQYRSLTRDRQHAAAAKTRTMQVDSTCACVKDYTACCAVAARLHVRESTEN